MRVHSRALGLARAHHRPVMIGVLMGVLDAAIVNVAIPSISGSLGAAPDLAAWVATGYTLGMMIVMPLNGWLTALLGQKHYYLAAFGLFTVMSCACGAAPSIEMLIVFRVVQGLGGGALQPMRSVDAADAMAAASTLGHPAISTAVGALGIERTRAMLAGMIAGNANVVSYLYLFRISAILFACTLPLLVFLPNLRAARRAPRGTPVNEELADELEAEPERVPAGVGT